MPGLKPRPTLRPKLITRRCDGKALEASQFAGVDEDSGEHGGVEPAGVGVAQRGVVTAQQVHTAGHSSGQFVARSVAEFEVRAACDCAYSEEMRKVAVPGDLAQADDDPHAGESGDLGGEVDGTAADLVGRGLVAGRGAADDRGDPSVTQAQAVVAGQGGGLGGETEIVEDGIHEGAGSVASEGATGAVGSVSSGRQAEDEDAGAGIAEAGDGAGPVDFVLVGTAARLREALAVEAQTGTQIALDDCVLDRLQDGDFRGGGKPCASGHTTIVRVFGVGRSLRP